MEAPPKTFPSWDNSFAAAGLAGYPGACEDDVAPKSAVVVVFGAAVTA